MRRLPAIRFVQAAFVGFWMLLLCASLGLKASARVLGWPRWGTFKIEENRRLAAFPDLRRLPAEKWGAGLDAWYNDQFAYRARIVQFYRFLLGDVLASPIVDNEVPGTGGWMYRNGESWPEIKDYLGVFELTPAETARWIEFFEGRCEWAAAHGARYLQAITPVKAQIHPEHLPPAVARHRGQCVREQVRAALEGSSAKDSVLFLTDAVREITDRGGRTYFYPSDHHVNGYGCYVIYREIMAAAERMLGPPMEMPPFYDDPPEAVRENREWGCWQCGATNYERLAVRMPDMEVVRSGAFDWVPPRPSAPIAFGLRGGARRTLVVAHDSFLRFPLYSWYHSDVEPVRIPLANGFDRAITLMFTRYTTAQLNRIVAAESPALIVEQFPEIRLTQDIRGLDATMRRAAAFSRGRPVGAEEAARLPEDTPLLARVTLENATDPTGTWTDMRNGADVPVLSVELLADGEAVAAEPTWPGPRRAVYFAGLPLGGRTVDVRISGGRAATARVDLRLPEGG